MTSYSSKYFCIYIRGQNNFVLPSRIFPVPESFSVNNKQLLTSQITRTAVRKITNEGERRKNIVMGSRVMVKMVYALFVSFGYLLGVT